MSPCTASQSSDFIWVLCQRLFASLIIIKQVDVSCNISPLCELGENSSLLSPVPSGDSPHSYKLWPANPGIYLNSKVARPTPIRAALPSPSAVKPALVRCASFATPQRLQPQVGRCDLRLEQHATDAILNQATTTTDSCCKNGRCRSP
ncbi:hypothetical protein CBL_03084 [Carabus blaptoides fortunei]